MKISHLLLTAGFFCFSIMASAQQIQTDRPDETEGPNTVAKHRLQVESGFSFEREEEEKTFEIPKVMLRYGLFKNTELRLESAFKITHEESEKQYGIEPFVIGIKYHFLDHKGALPDAGILGSVSIPWLADNAYQEPKYSPEIRMLAQHELSKSTHLSYNLGIHWMPIALQPEYIYTIAADYAVTKKIKVVAETYGFTQPHHHAQNTADVAVLFLVNKDLQLDLITGSGIMHSFSDKFVELGLSFRI